jgi:very-short-patch-repair endonuclease
MECITESPIEQAFAAAWNDKRIPLEAQYPVGSYFVDFAHVPTKTAIELDGFATHSSAEDIAKDRKRQREIELLGWHVIRFGGKEVLTDVQACIRELVEMLSLRASFLGYDGIPDPEPAIPYPPPLLLSSRLCVAPPVGWSDFWGSWTVHQEEDADRVLCGLWLAQLLCLGQGPVYVVHPREVYDRFAEWAYEYRSPLILTQDLGSGDSYQRFWCYHCRSWARSVWVRGERERRCLGCRPQDIGRPAARGSRDLLLSDAFRRTLFAQAMKMWEHRLSPQQRTDVRPYVHFIGGYRPGTYVCKLLAGIALAQLAPGNEIKTQEMSDFFWQVPWVREQLNRAQWDRLMSTGLSVWITHGWIEKRARGIYRRLVTPVREAAS